ncbi:hypothetical protein [Peribacillus sp. SI8-4]|uniref:hypothetical protein n=1 Tax=Peribacillus sp. SI8-4 TaxID=3048009 RepID=UPI0025557F60|nr:hypothetical protein [Peribacillus sp. SI8-4]
MKHLFRFVAAFNERKALERETDEFFRKEYENYMKLNPDNGVKRRLAPRLYVIDGGKKGAHHDISDRKKSS